MSLTFLSEQEIEDNEDYARWQFETARAEWEAEQQEERIMSLIDDIKAKYPNPCAASDVLHAANYCVGGAICLYRYGKDSTTLRFPETAVVGTYLRALNPDLPSELAHRYANLIVTANDAGNFAHAWHIAQQALEYEAAQDID